jgi:SAM-dependent methyltransferase
MLTFAAARRAVTWDAYLDRFHAERPGITEAILRAARDDGGVCPYAWLASAVPPGTRVLDLGCGSAPMFGLLAASSWVGLDRSAAELAAARDAGARPLLRARAAAVPLRDASVDLVACSMSLMVTTPLPEVIGEVSRVLRPGGLLAATVPASGPLRGKDRIAIAGLLAALGRAPSYPVGRDLASLPALLARYGLRVLADDLRRFGYRMHGRADAVQLMASLYLPGLPRARYRLARAWLGLLAASGAEFPVPVRRIIAGS